MSSARVSGDPCLQIQADLSAMVDGELDAKLVRRVMVHSDVCESCCEFLSGIRSQVHAHQTLTGAGLLRDGDAVDGGVGATEQLETLRRQLVDNRKALARILYELGRGFVLMGLSPKFSKVVASEPVPVPDMAQKGRNLLHEVEAQVGASGVLGAGGLGEGAQDTCAWVRAKELLDSSSVDNPARNLAKGERLLRECVLLEPSFHEARIYLGMVHHVQERHEDAIDDLQAVLDGSDQPGMISFALLNLGNVHLDLENTDKAFGLFERLVTEGHAEDQPRFKMVYFNLGLVCAMRREFDSSREWFARLHRELPHKRAMIGRELATRDAFRNMLHREPEEAARFADQFPCWFPLEGTQTKIQNHGASREASKTKAS